VTAAQTQRLWWAMQLARDVETCASLMRGEPVDEQSLDPAALQGARQRSTVILLDVEELFDVKTAA
jgi:hypothetical protein